MIAPDTQTPLPTIWGLDAQELHARFWAARGVCVVRQGESSELAPGAELFLLTDPRTFAIFRLRPLLDVLSWIAPDVLVIRLRNTIDRGYRERILTDPQGNFLRFERSYGGSDSRLARVALTRRPDIASAWQSAPDIRAGWRLLRERVERSNREVSSLKGRSYDRTDPAEIANFVHDLVGTWRHPSTTIPGLRSLAPGVWAPADADVPPRLDSFGPVWVGAGRSAADFPTLLGPAALWDSPQARPAPQRVRWEELEPGPVLDRPVKPRKPSSLHQLAKRGFDIAFALIALILTLPLYPLVMLAIWFEDGRPFFFAHRRETVGGREFPCIKFRSMRKDADQIKAKLAEKNQADGPQFFIQNDPRLTRVGRIIRKLNIDELPQFINVLLGQMSVVGPRPSPRKENQCCPPWREARLSVRPGITGLWQVSRTRKPGLDFQEWIRFDIQYVENASLLLDLKIIAQTVMHILFGE